MGGANEGSHEGRVERRVARRVERLFDSTALACVIHRPARARLRSDAPPRQDRTAASSSSSSSLSSSHSPASSHFRRSRPHPTARRTGFLPMTFHGSMWHHVASYDITRVRGRLRLGDLQRAAQVLQVHEARPDGVGCNVIQCNTMSCNVMQRHAMQCNAMQCNVMQCHAMSCNAMQCNAM